MSTIPQVSEAMRRILTERATALERSSGFVQRSSAQLTGAIFAQTTIFGWLALPEASYSHLRHVAASLGVQVSNQAVEQRFGAGSVQLMRQLVEEAVGEVMSSQSQAPDVLARFNGVYLQDGTIITLPASLAEHWPTGAGEEAPNQQSSLRLQVRLDWSAGHLQGPWLQAGQQAEASGEALSTPLPVGSLWNVDSGYLNLARMRELGHSDRFWLSPAKTSLLYIDERGVRSSLEELLKRHSGDEVDLLVRIGASDQLPVRLIARRVWPQEQERRRKQVHRHKSVAPKGARRPNVRRPPLRTKTGKRNKNGDRQRKRRSISASRERLLGWTILVTNVPQEQLSVTEAIVVARCRWQIELFWKLIKQIGKIDTWRSEKPERLLTEIYAKILGMLITHWLPLVQCWQQPHRSLVKARQVVQWMAPALALAVAGALCLQVIVGRTVVAMEAGCRVQPRRKRPATFQLVRDPTLIRRLG